MIPERAAEIVSKSKASAVHGPWSDQINEHMTPEERIELVKVWKTLPGSTTFADVLMMIASDAYESKRRYIQVHYDNGEIIETPINGTVDEIRKYYIGNTFNLGDGAGGDELATAVSVEFLTGLDDDDTTARIITCDLCGKNEVEHDAIESGWIPSYWIRNLKVVMNPVCAECVKTRIEELDGENVLIPVDSMSGGASCDT